MADAASTHASLIASAEQSVTSATRTARELGIALANARRDRDMLLVTCLSDAIETVKAANAAAIETLSAMNATTQESEARALSSKIRANNQKLLSALQNAARCEGETDVDGSSVVMVDDSSEYAVDPNDANTVPPSISPPPIGLPPAQLPTIDVMEPGTDIPTVPRPASPMR